MTPLVIGLATVVVVILIVVAVGLRYVRNDERAGADGRQENRGGTRGRPDQDWGRAPRPNSGGYDDRAARGGDRGYGEAGRGPDDRRRDGGGRAAREHDDRRDQPVRLQARQEARSQVRARSARGRRDDDGDWPSTEWDKLSDADYWKEVASDKPLTTTAQPAQGARPGQLPRDSRTGRPDRDRDAARYPGQPGGRGHQPERGREPEHDRRPMRESARPAARGALQPAAGRGDDFLPAPAAGRYPEPVRADLPPADLGRQAPARPGPASPGSMPSGPRPAAPALYDDDPLTSPSFPAVAASDSRSYHSGRSSSRPADQAGPASYGAPTTRLPAYGAAQGRPAGDVTGDRYGRGLADSSSATTAPRSYQPIAQPAAGRYPANGHQYPANGQLGAGRIADTAAGISPASRQPSHAPPPGPPQPVRPPAGNPYGSYVSTDLPGFPDSPTSVYSQPRSPAGYPGYSAAQDNGRDAAYRYELPAGDSAAPLAGRASDWYPRLPAAMAADRSPGVAAPFPQLGAQTGGGMPSRDSAYGRPSPSGYAPGPYAGGNHNLPDYPPGGHAQWPDVPAPGGRHSASQQDAARYPPPEFYGRDGHGGETRR